MSFSITRQIDIDTAHRVPTHGSKCWNLHGHRYVILAEATATGLHAHGEQRDMVLDFGFMKSIMMNCIYDFCDHGAIFWNKDPLLSRFLGPNYDLKIKTAFIGNIGFEILEENKLESICKTLLVEFIPTAERLAEFWHDLMYPEVNKASKGLANLTRVEVRETPNGIAYYPGSKRS